MYEGKTEPASFFNRRELRVGVLLLLSFDTKLSSKRDTKYSISHIICVCIDYTLSFQQ